MCSAVINLWEQTNESSSLTAASQPSLSHIRHVCASSGWELHFTHWETSILEWSGLLFLIISLRARKQPKKDDNNNNNNNINHSTKRAKNKQSLVKSTTSVALTLISDPFCQTSGTQTTTAAHRKGKVFQLVRLYGCGSSIH